MANVEKRFMNSSGQAFWVADNALDEHAMCILYKALLASDVTVLGCSNEGTVDTREIMFDLDHADFAKCEIGNCISELVTEITMEKYACYKVIGNFIRYGSQSFIHQDADKCDIMSVLYFANTEWRPEWAGEFTFFNDGKDAEACVSVRPGRIIIFPAHLYHRAGVPSRACTETRVTVSARYAPM